MRTQFPRLRPRQWGAAGLVLLVSTAVGLTAQSASARSGRASAAGPVLRVSNSADLRGFDATRFWDPTSFTVDDLIFSRLVRIDPRNASRLLPDLAAVPKPTNGGTTYTFKLRAAKFQNGSPVTASDVKFSLERLLNPKTKSEAGTLYGGLIKDTDAIVAGKATTSTGIKVVDARTVSITLTSPRSTFLYLLAMPWASIVPKAVVASESEQKWNLHPIGSGPFSMTLYQPGRIARFVRFAGYYDAKSIKLPGIDITLNVSPETALLQIDHGDLDLMLDDVPSASYNAIKNDPSRKSRLVESVIDNSIFITVNAVDASSVWRDERVRRAMAMAIDKRRIVQQLQGRAVPATGFFSTVSQYYDPKYRGIPYDPAGAKKLIKAAGAVGKTVTILALQKGQYPVDSVGPSIAQDLQATGLKVKLETLASSTWLTKTMDKDLLVPTSWVMDSPHGSFVVDSAFTEATKKAADASGACCNFSRWSTPAIEKLAQSGDSTANKTTEIADYRKIMNTVVDKAIWIPLVYPKRALYAGKDVRGLFVPTNYEGIYLRSLSLARS